MLDKDGFKFDFETRRFITERWETDLGKKVYELIIEGIKSSMDIRNYLSPHILKHSDNSSPYEYPIYPKSEMKENLFWVLNESDLRGIQINGEDFSNTLSLHKKSLSYSNFTNCILSNNNMERVDLSYAKFKDCTMNDLILSGGGFNIQIYKCDLRNACLDASGFINCDFRGSNFSNVYWGNSLIENIRVDYQTKFDTKVRTHWKETSIKNEQQSNRLHSIRVLYEKSELWNRMDSFLFYEKVAERKYILWLNFQDKKSFSSFYIWIKSYLSGLFSGYSTKPFRVMSMSMIISLIFALIYYFMGTPSNVLIESERILEALYFSFTTFTTLGYGDIVYDSNRPFMRLVSTFESWVGVINISLFVVALARKFFR